MGGNIIIITKLFFVMKQAIRQLLTALTRRVSTATFNNFKPLSWHSPKWCAHKLLTAFILLFSVKAFAQMPVQVMPQLIPPYSLQVSDYYSGTIPKLQLLLLNRDINQPTIQVKLRMTVESQNCRLRTKDNAQTPTFTLTNGVPYYLTPQELQAFFAPANIDFTGGYSEQQYVQTGRLPEGLYSFYFEAFELYSGNLVSNKGFSLAWLTLADPPILNTPAKAENATPTSPQNIIFNWTPRHNTSPTAAYFTDYVFTLVEYNDLNLGPEASFTTSPPLFIDSIQTTTYLFGPAQPQLVPGKRYAWRVQAKAKNGAQQLAMFRNNGFSEVHWFTYQNACAAPLGISSSVQGQRVTIEWQNNPLHLDYKVEYREKNNPDAQWFNISNTLPRVMLTDLKSGTQYEYRVGGSCSVGQFAYSSLLSFTTNGTTANNLPACGDSTLPAPGSGSTLQTLVQGDVIKAGSFDVTVGYATGTGSFTGSGYVVVPWLANAKVEVRFTNITLSLDKKLLTGVIETTYDPTEAGIDDIDEYVDIFTAGYGVGSVVTGEVTADTTFNFTIQMPNGISVQVPTGYDVNTGKGQGPITVTVYPQGGGNPVSYTVNELPTTLQDKDGNIYQVTKGQQVIALGSKGGEQWLKKTNTKHIDKDKAVVKFVDYPDKQVYAFDEWKDVYKKSSTFSKEYERLNDDYYVSAKAIAQGKTDYLKAVVTINDNSIIADSIKYINGKGTIYKATKLQDGSYEIAIVGGPEKDAQEIYAVYPQGGGKTLNLGKVLVASYPRREYKVRLVPVNSATINIDSVINGLKKVYGPVNIDFTVEMDSVFIDNTWDKDNNGLTVTGSGDFALLTDEMKSLNNAYRNRRTINKDVTYLFIVNTSNETGVKGDMPRGKQFGYLFVAGNNTLGRTSAHEIAHGKFRFKHITEYGGLGEFDLLDNLMAKGNGTQLNKSQWDLLHDPAILAINFDKDEDAMDKESFEKLEDLLKAIRDRTTTSLEYDISPLYWGIHGGAYGSFDLNKDGKAATVYLKFPEYYIAPTTNGVISFSVSGDNSLVGVRFLVNLNNSLHNEFDIKFNKNGTNDLAFSLRTYDYESCKELLEYFRFSLTEGTKTFITNQYKTAITEAGNDCNKLDVLFETIPDFVINSADPVFSDASLWQYLKGLANCSMGSAGTDDEKAAINILAGFKNKQNLYTYLKNDNETTAKLYRGIDGDNCYQFLNYIADLCDTYGSPPLSNYFAYIGKVPYNKYTSPDEICNGKSYLITVGSNNYTSVGVSCNIGEITGIFGTGTHNFKNINSFTAASFLDRCTVYRNVEGVYDVLPILYLGHLGQKQGEQEMTQAINKSTMFLGFSGAVRVLFMKGTGYLAKAIAFGEITKLAIDGFMADEDNRKIVAGWGPEGKWIAENWNTISITIDLTTLSSQFLINFARNGAHVSNKLRVRGETNAADELDEMIKTASALRGYDEVFDLDRFKNLSGRVPSGSELTRLKRIEFVEHGYRIRPSSNTLKNKIDDIVEYGDNLGAKTESIVDEIMTGNGYTKLDGKYGSNNGFDGIYIKGDISNPSEIIVVESKQFKYTNGVADEIIEHNGISLNPPSSSTPLPAQMSDDWIEYVRVKLDQAGKTDIAQMLFLNKQKITKYVTAVDKTQGEINFLKLASY